VVHLAAQGGVNRSWRAPAADARCNVVGSVGVFAAARGAGCRLVVAASSGGALYGDSRELPTPEDAPVAPRSPYGTAKAAMERYLELMLEGTGCALRYGNVYGPGQDGTGEAGLVAISCHRLLRGLVPQVRGDGLQGRDFVYVADVVSATLRALEQGASGAFNVGTGVETAVVDVVRHLCEVAEVAEPPEHVEPVPEVRRSCLDTARAAAGLGWAAKTQLAEGLALTYRSFAEAAAG
jgi:UDP-glucose 4-epimerase